MPDDQSRQTDIGLHADSFRGHGRVSIYDARGNGGGIISPTITGDHQNRITDYTAIVVYEDIHREAVF